MRLLFLASFNDKLPFGGGDYYIYNLAENLAMRGHSVTMFWVDLTNFKSQSNNLVTRKKFYVKEKFRGTSRINKYLENIYDYFSLEKYIKKNSKKIDYIVGYQTRQAIKATRYGRKYKIKVANFIFETPELLSESPSFRSIQGNPSWSQTWLNFKSSLISSDLLFSISDLTKHSAEKWLDKNIDEVIHPGLKPDNFIKKSFTSNHIIYIGRLEKSKKVDVLIEALSKIKNHPKLIICGFGSQKNSLINLATKLNVNFDYRGVVAEQEKWKLISSSLFMVFPTTFEGFGMPPMEALYCKKPCITTDLKILKSNYGDYLEYVKVNDVDDLSMKIKFLLDNPKYVEERGKKGREFVLNKFNWEKSAELLEKSFESNR